jgi:hypothetical protein
MPPATTTQVTASIRVVGGLLPADMINRIMTGKDVSGSTPADYHVVGVRSVKDAAERHWDYLKGAWRVLRDAVGHGSDPRGLAIENWLLPLFDEHGYGRPPGCTPASPPTTAPRSSRSATPGNTCPSTSSPGARTSTNAPPPENCHRSRCCRTA